MKTTTFVLCLLATPAAFAGLDAERALLRQDPAKAAAAFQEQLTQNPDDPWLLYNAGVAAYAAKDYARADQLWQHLTTVPMPDELRDQAWMQIGNVSFRLAQPQIAGEPDAALSRLEQSREALRVALALNKRNDTASKNLKVIEGQLEDVYARLGKRLLEESRKETSNGRAIEKLEAALPYAQQALSLDPTDTQRQAEKKEIEKELAARLDQRAADEEKLADNTTAPQQREQAKEHLQNALSDFQQAQVLDPQDQIAKEGEKRVEGKLANLFAQAGRQDQRAAENLRQPQQQLDRFQQALENFEQALAIQPEHADAKAGAEEVRARLAQLHLNQGDRQAQQGERQLQNNPEQAADNLQQALENFQEAQALAPQNPTIQPRIDRVQAMLPQLLEQLAQQQMQQGEQNEQNNQNENALENYQEAEQNFAQANEMTPSQSNQQGMQQAQAAIARLSAQMAQAQGQGQSENPGESQTPSDQENPPGFSSMLSKLKEDLRNREVNARPNPGQRYTQDRNRNLRNW